MHRTSRPPHTYFRRARTMLWQVTLAFGPPSAILALGYLLRPDHTRIAQWVFALERLVRKILVFCALTLDLPPPKPRAARPPRPRSRTLHLWWPERPATWPVRFRLWLPQAGRPRRWRIRNPEPRRFVPTQALAFRLEAVAEVLRAPKRFIRRAACRLARLQAANACSNDPRDLLPILAPEPRDPALTPNRAAAPAEIEAGGRIWAWLERRDSG